MPNDKSIWMTSIHLRKVRNLKDLTIKICDCQERRHLILTGPNGSGKTSLLMALRDHLVALAADRNLQVIKVEEQYESFEKQRQRAKDAGDLYNEQRWKQIVSHFKGVIEKLWGEVRPSYTEVAELPIRFAQNEFIISYYEDCRKSEFISPMNPEKPNIKFGIRENNVREFLKFLVDLKVQQALARNEQHMADAEAIEDWFNGFVSILKKLFHDASLELIFNYHDYSFLIKTQMGEFPFTGLSAGYSAVLDIITDLILKMQTQNRYVRVFDMPGIVLIDELETHLHLSLQKDILPLLTSIFPRIQFIVSTHSPFILNAIRDVTVYDLASHETVQDMSEYSYDVLAEGFLGVKTESGELERRLERMKKLIEHADLNEQKIELEGLMKDFETIPDSLAPSQKARFYRLQQMYLEKKGL